MTPPTSSRPSLPAFGIRDLNGPEAPPGVVQLLEEQYDTTIAAYPEALLSYVDDDDGETITVGSSYELGQRLEEPVRHSTLPVIPALRTSNESTENGLMHIFDIKQTSASLSVWREHEAYTSKTIREKTTSSAGSSSTSLAYPSLAPPVAPSQVEAEGSDKTDNHINEVASLDADTVNQNAAEAQVPALLPTSTSVSSDKSPITPREHHLSTNLDKAFAGIFGSIESRLGPLADFLETTADGLRKLADKTANSESSALEDVLGGFKDILTQVGEFGLGVAAVISEEIEKSKATLTSPLNQHAHQQMFERPAEAVHVSPLSQHAHQQMVERPAEDPSPQPEKPHAPSKPDTARKRVSFDASPSSAQKPMSTPAPQFPVWVPIWYTHSEEGQKRSMTPQYPQRTHTSSARHSILDMESTDPDFSARYPPLLSLRKAKSVNELHNTTQGTSSSQSNTALGSAAVRYPSLRQFEQEARATVVNKSLADSKSRKDTPLQPELKPRKNDSYKAPSVEEDIDTENSATSPIKAPSLHPDPPTPLPGAWPEFKTEDMSALPTNTAPNTETVRSSQYGKATRPQQSRAGTSQRMGYPSSAPYPRPPVFPDALRDPGFPRRNQTVSGTNPAARLNGPFDPLAHYPTLQPRPHRSQPDLHDLNRIAENTLNHKPSLPAFFPQRSATVNYTDRYIPRYVSPSVFLDRTREYAAFRKHVKNYWDADHMPGPSYGVRYFSPNSARSETSNIANIPTNHPAANASTTQPLRAVASDASSNSNTQKSARWYQPGATALHNSTNTSTLPDEPFAIPSCMDHLLGPKTGVRTNSSQTFVARAAPEPNAFQPALSPATRSPYVPTSYATPQPSSLAGSSRVPPSVPSSCTAVNECIEALKDMGFGTTKDEMTRLLAVAGATAGNLEDAIDMLEEDREASEQLGYVSDVATNGSARSEQEELEI
ncbi:hypothetical protein LTR34_008826 [Exophiala xenobiotica]|nr:hypothetical protein LTR34_008826 [Exophiala xenobiotica]